MAIEHSIEWSADGYNGLIDWLGENKVGDAFANPVTLGYVTASQSTTFSGAVASRALDQVIDVTSGRSHTENVDGSWWQADFGAGNAVGVRRVGIIGQDYSLNHPRYFVVLGSNGDGVWHELASAEDVGPAQAAWWSVAVTDDSPYRYIKILASRDDADSTGNEYMILGDVEIWGDYHDAAAPAAAYPLVTADSGRGWRGLFEWLGQNKTAGAWLHPESGRSLVVTSQSTTYTTYVSGNAINHSFAGTAGGMTHTDNVVNSWWKVDLGLDNLFRLDALALYGKGAHLPRNFRVEGSLDDSTWVEVYDVPNATTGPELDAWFVTDMDVTTTEYRYFRVTMYGASASGFFPLTIGSLEFYGGWNPPEVVPSKGLMLMGVG